MTTYSPIKEFTIQFSIDIMDFTELLRQSRHDTVANQLIKSGTSIGANVTEAQNAESRRDFIHKMKLALKEAEETKYWLTLCQAKKNYPCPQELSDKLIPIIKILNKIIYTSKKQL